MVSLNFFSRKGNGERKQAGRTRLGMKQLSLSSFRFCVKRCVPLALPVPWASWKSHCV